MSAASVGGGPGNLVVANNSSTRVSDSSAATSQSGISVALAPTAVASAASPSPDTGITTAASGGSTATGVTASNDVSHTAVVGVSVGGGSQAPVNVTSNASVLVQDQGASAAVSGQAWAVAPGASGSPSGVTPPVVTGASGPSSPNVASTGLQVQNDLSTATRNTVNTIGGPTATAPIVITRDEVASVTAKGVTSVASASAACVTPGCQPIGPSAAGGSQAASGTADTRGLIAQNVVNTQAAVAVHVGGRNFSPIQIIVDSITKIVNLGIASSQSGDATAGSGGQPVPVVAGQAVASGNVQATGAQVRNNADLRSAATVHVSGDNYSPIDIVLNLATTLFNRGIAIATSGDAQSSAGGAAGTATSGATQATGLQAMNVVNMFADAAVDIDGNNYAPIVVEVHFNTTIDNIGIGVATSGNVASGGSGAQAKSSPNSSPKTSTASPSTAATSGGSTQPASARGGDATAIANSIDAAFNSAQLSNANGSASQSTALITQMLRNLTPKTFDPFVDPPPPTPTTTGSGQDGTTSSSGNTLSTGLHAAVQQDNTQLVVCTDPGVNCIAKNSASMTAAIADSPTNLAERGNPSIGGTTTGGATASSGDALLNATPTPTPSTSNASVAHSGVGQSNGSSGRSRDSRGTTRQLQFTSQTVATGVAANGHTVLVDFWDTWPGRRLPPMPNLESHAPTTSRVDVGVNSWPGADELPLPELSSNSGSTQRVAAVPRASTAVTTAIPSIDQPAESEEDAPLNVLAVYQADPFGSWPALDALPLPPQIVTAGAVAEAEDVAPQSPEEASGFDNLALVELLGATLIGAAIAGVGGTRRGRQGILTLLRSLIR